MPNSINSNNNDSENGGNMSGNLMFLLAGCGIGATLALLFAPKSGQELRSDISDITRKGYDETLDLAHELKDRSTELYNSLRESGQRVYDVAASKLQLVENPLEENTDRINGEMTTKSGKSSQSNVGDRPPSTIH